METSGKIQMMSLMTTYSLLQKVVVRAIKRSLKSKFKQKKSD